MKVSITESQYERLESRFNYENIVETMIFKITLLIEDGKTKPDMEWDFTDAKKELDLSTKWVETVEDAKEYIETVKQKIKNLPEDTKKKILKYVLYSFLGLLTLDQIDSYLEPKLQSAVKTEKKIVQDWKVRKSSDKLLNHLKYEEGSIRHKGQPVLTAYDIGDGAYTIGYGHAIFPDEEESFEFLPRYSDIIPGQTKITKDEAETLLKDDLREAESIINRILDDWDEQGIKPKLTQGMYDAMVSMAYNMGAGIRTSDFIQYVKRGDLKGAKEKILTTSENLFDEFPGLEPRRKKESEMFK